MLKTVLLKSLSKFQFATHEIDSEEKNYLRMDVALWCYTCFNGIGFVMVISGRGEV